MPPTSRHKSAVARRCEPESAARWTHGASDIVVYTDAARLRRPFGPGRTEGRIAGDCVDMSMKWVSSLSTLRAFADAAEDALRDLAGQLGGDSPDLVVAFVSGVYAEHAPRLTEIVSAWFPRAVLFGCTGGGVLGGGREIEHEPAVALAGAVLPGVDIQTFHIDQRVLPAPTSPRVAWRALVDARPEHNPCFLLLPDPYSVEAECVIAGLDRAYPGAPKVGGLVSGGTGPGTHALYLGEAVHRSGVVGLALSGNIELDTVVAQGCRPIGEPMFATRCLNNVVFELDGMSATDVLEALYESLSPDEQSLFRDAMFVGLGVSHERQSFGPGDFLVRNVLGADPQAKALAVGAAVEEKQVVQFHIRDAQASAEDLRRMLVKHREQRPDRPRGALMFSCLGRGQGLYGRSDHDSQVFRELIGPTPLAGFFCNGEIGPINGQTWIHRYTSAFGFFRPRRMN